MGKELLNYSQIQQIYNLIRDNYETSEHLKPTFPELLREHEDGIGIMCLSEDDKIVAVSFYKEITEHLAQTFRTVVHKKKRRKGYAKKLNANIEALLKAKGYKKITCDIYTDNIPSIVLKLKRGYVIEGTRFDHDNEGVHEYTLGKRL